MTARVIQSSFNSGEWAPNLYARTDLEKYHSGAAVLRNFFVDYRGGASTRTGTKYCLRGYGDGGVIRVIPFQATFSVGYACEFGNNYVRFYQNGAPVLESGLTITGITNANPAVISVVNSYTTGSVDWVYVSGVSGMTQINGKYFIVHTRTGGSVTIYDLFGNPVDSTTWGAWTSGGTVQRIYTIGSPFADADLALIKFAQNVTELILCHPNYAPQVLVYNSPTNWTLTPIVFGATIAAPSTGLAFSTTLGAGQTSYAYAITSIDSSGQESGPSLTISFGNTQNIAQVLGTNTIAWNGVSGAVSYNVYRANTTQLNPVPVGVPFGFIGNVTGTVMADTNIAPDFTIAPPVPRNPFATGSGVQSVSVTNRGSYTTAPTVTIAGPGGGGVTATGFPVLTEVLATVSSGGTGFTVGDTVLFPGNLLIQVATLSGSAIATFNVLNTGTETVLPANPLAQSSSSGAGTGAQLTVNWGVQSITITNPGSGYGSVPAVTFSSGAAAGTAVLGATGNGNPSVPAFFQQRLVFAAPNSAPQTLYMSQPGNFFNFNVSFPIQADDAITASIISGQLNTIKAMINQPAGLIVLTDGSSWLVNGGSFGAAVTPASIVANAQSFNGANDMPPIVVVFDMLYSQSKGSVVRDSLYNFYANVYTGTDISILSSHLFFGFQLKEWAFAEEPFKTVWCVRNDGVLLCLTFLKEQDFIAWTHHDTNGAFQSVCSTIETTAQGPVNATYVVVSRVINNVTVKYIERFAERYMPNGVADAWSVDCGIQYSGSPATSFQGAEFLAGLTVTGLADGKVITPFTMPASGSFTLGTPASKVTVGLPFTPQLQTLYLDIGKPTIQGKQKKIPAVTIRVADTLGLEGGTDFSDLVVLKDLVVGNVGSLTNTTVTGLVTGDAKLTLDPKWSAQGQFCLQQNLPFPATILGVVPEVATEGVKG